MRITIDASVAATWLLPDEANARSDELLKRAVAGDMHLQAPALWLWEVGNLLRMATQRGRLRRGDWPAALQVVQETPVRIEQAPESERFATTLSLAADHALSFYDASYLEQAQRTAAALATLDGKLHKAAGKLGVTCLPL